MKAGYSLGWNDAAIRDLVRVGCSQLFSDDAPFTVGAWRDRPGLRGALASLHRGDTLVVKNVGCIADSLRGLVDVVAECERRGSWFETIQGAISVSGFGSGVLRQLSDALSEHDQQWAGE